MTIIMIMRLDTYPGMHICLDDVVILLEAFVSVIPVPVLLQAGKLSAKKDKRILQVEQTLILISHHPPPPLPSPPPPSPPPSSVKVLLPP